MSSFSSMEGGSSTPRDLRGALAAIQYAECPICFDPLCQQRCGSMNVRDVANEGRFVRSCAHYFHKNCLESLGRPSCPMCRQEFTDIIELPNALEDPEGWFRAIDVDGDGELSYQEVIDGLKTVLPVDWQNIEADTDRMWSRWDPDQSGQINLREFLERGSGLMSYLAEHFPRIERSTPPPMLDHSSRSRWIESADAFFQYWDSDTSGSLEQGEMTRALVKTFRLNHSNTNSIADTIENIWPIFDLDGNGTISKEEFSAVDGLGESIVAQLASER